MAGPLLGIPIEAVAVGIGLFALLALLVSADPPSRVTVSVAPFTDEAFNALNARNWVQLGRWSTDEWNLHLVNLPFSVLIAGTFELIGVGMVQARLATILCVSLTAMALVWGLRGAVGRACALFAGLAFATSGLILIYGRLVFLEDLVVLGLTLGTLCLARDARLTLGWGLAAGACYAIAIGTKPSCAFSVAGILVALAVVWGWRDRAMRRWIAGTIAAIGLLGLAWVLLVWLPNRDAVAMDLRIWAQVHLSLTPGDVVRSVSRYFTRENDHLFGTMLGPLLILGAAGVVAIGALRRRLSQAEARLAVAALGWAAFGFGILLIASYRPNRYVVPLVPALAILACIGLHVAGAWLQERVSGRTKGSGADAGAEAVGGAGSARRSTRAERWTVPLLTALAIVVVVAPGLRWYSSWAGHATSDLPSIQDRFGALVPEGERVAGRESALFLMRSKAVTIVTQFVGGAANEGDLYADGVRWYLLPAGDPAPKGVPENSWSAREAVACADWNDETECLFRVP